MVTSPHPRPAKRAGRLFAAFLAGAGLWWSGASTLQAREVTDILGRHVQVPDHPQRIVLGEGRLIYALEPLEGEGLFKRVVGWQGEFRSSDAQNYNALKAIHPEAERVAVIGRNSADTISPEKILQLRPDVAIFSTTGHGPGQSGPVTQRLAEAHIPVVFVDFRADPVKNTVPSMLVLGQTLDRQREAKAYADFYQDRLSAVRKAVAEDKHPAPRVFIDMLGGQRPNCCHTAGNGNMGAFIEVAGGDNLAAKLLPGFMGEVTPEWLMAAQPDALILDGTRPGGSTGPGVQMGAMVSAEQARASMERLLESADLTPLKAAHDGHTWGVWHAFYDNPFNILAIEAMATWFHPSTTASIHPEADLRTIQARFHGLPGPGTYWAGPVSLPAKQGAQP
ncbi:ABC transporter substrate-binding protein [Formicincola oecophyllae]|uniref:ABC transporter substrate-binding protein n=1 Tax=Formicincola oecophyllae TaxID=2558361 RepID=A0A4Y6UBT1_9PROT|nr:ABC transporter substrate-binding protein [Formicincola oecophyllae]QDH13927.1 ABC transporter substrate-binding protein [Formicincola oecophyllae]